MADPAATNTDNDIVDEDDLARGYINDNGECICGMKPHAPNNFLGPDEFACGPIYALELAMNNHAKYIKTKVDVLIVWFHWCLLRNGFYFFGGELTHNDFHSETLPPNLCFNGDRTAHVLKYGKGLSPYVCGVYIKDDSVDISLVSLYKSLRLNVGIDDLVDDCLNLQDDTVQQLTMLVDDELIKPMSFEAYQRDCDQKKRCQEALEAQAEQCNDPKRRSDPNLNCPPPDVDMGQASTFVAQPHAPPMPPRTFSKAEAKEDAFSRMSLHGEPYTLVKSLPDESAVAKKPPKTKKKSSPTKRKPQQQVGCCGKK